MTNREKLESQWGGYNIKKREIKRLVLPAKKHELLNIFMRLEIMIKGSDVPIIMYDLDKGRYYNNYKEPLKNIKRKLENILNVTSIRPYWNRNIRISQVVVPGDIIVVWGNNVRAVLNREYENNPHKLKETLNNIKHTLDSHLFL